MKRNRPFHIFAFGAQGTGVSGGDRIFLELARRLSAHTEVHLWMSAEGQQMTERMSLSPEKIHFHIKDFSFWRRLGPVFYNLRLVVEGLSLGLFGKVPNAGYVYSASEFWMDSFPALFWKLRQKKLTWVASWYQTAPNPLKGFSLQGSPRHRIASIPYWFFQQTTKPYISRFADYINVNNQSEVSEFPQKKSNVFIMYGAVDTEKAAYYSKRFYKLPKKYDAVFQGRFHPQKGVEEMIEIWAQVVAQKPNAKLVMIGDGPLMTSVKEAISSYKLQKSVTLLGYQFDGDKKYQTFIQSAIVVHPAFYDSGGMASAEAMIFGLPCVGFNLPAYKDYYPKGMVKVPLNDKKAFAKAVIKLLDDKNYYKKVAEEAKEMVYKNWSWDNRVSDFWNFIN